MAEEVTRLAHEGRRQPTRAWVTVWLAVTLTVTVVLAVVEAPAPAHAMPPLVLLVSLLFGSPRRDCA